MRLGRMLWRGGSALLTSTLLATLLVAVGVQQRATSPIVSEAPERAAGSTYLCTGYAGCRNAGYSDAGYGAVNSQMYWRMYSGHNCTNYAAYRMIQAGLSTERPWSGTGMAYNWGHAMAQHHEFTSGCGGRGVVGPVRRRHRVERPRGVRRAGGLCRRDHHQRGLVEW